MTNPMLRLVRHQGTLIAVLGRDTLDGPELRYDVLDPSVDSPGDAFDWSGLRALPWPSLISPVGAGMVRIPVDPATTGLPTSDCLQVVSDEEFILVFRTSTRGTVVVARYVLVRGSEAGTSGRPTPYLQPALESRFRATGSAFTPAGDRDSLSSTAPDGSIYLEPAHELSEVRVSAGLGFAVLLAPGLAPSHGSWHVFTATDGGADLRVTSLPRDEFGLFEPPARASTVSLATSAAPDAMPLILTTVPAALLYYQQEPAGTDPARGPVTVKRNARALVCAGVRPPDSEETAYAGTADEAVAWPTAVLDLGVAADGTLAQLPDGGADPPQQCAAPPIGTVDHCLSFPPGASASLDSAGVPLGDNGFTMECWLRAGAVPLDDTVDVAGGGPGAPTLRVVDGGYVEFRFDGSAGPVSLRSTDRVVAAGTWQHVAVTGSSTGSLLLHLNGASVPVDSVGAGTPGTAPPVLRFGATTSTRGVDLDEVRIWITARTPLEIAELMYRQLTREERARPDLAGYWPFDTVTTEVDSSGRLTLTVADCSTGGHTAVLTGARALGAGPPVAPELEPAVYRDGLGLVSLVGLLDDVRSPVGPCLLDGADGQVHLYGASEAGLLQAAAFDSSSSRAVLAMACSGGVQKITTRTSGVLGNLFTATVSGGPTPHLCTLSLSPDGSGGRTEQWAGLPRRTTDLAVCLAGRAAADPTDPRVARGALPFYDYRGVYPTAVLSTDAADGADPALLVSRRPWGGEEYVPGSLPLAGAEVAAEGGGAGTDLVLTFAAGPAPVRQVRQTWTDVPLTPSALGRVLSGTDPRYPYEGADGDALVYAVATGGGAPVLLVTTDPAVIDGSIDVTAATSGSGHNCDVAISFSTSTSTATHVLTWSDVPIRQPDFVQWLTTQESTGGPLATWAVLSGDGQAADVLVPQVVRDKADLRATSSLVQLIAPAPDIPLVTQPYREAEVIGGVTTSGFPSSPVARDGEPDGDVVAGSRVLIGVVPALGNGGDPLALLDGAASMWSPGTGGGWTAPVPGFGLDLQQLVASRAPGTGTAALALDAGVTLEAWVRPSEGEQQTRFPRLVGVSAAGAGPVLDGAGPDSTGYFLALARTSAVSSTEQNQVSTRVQLPAGVSLRGRFDDPQRWTACVWVRPEKLPAGATYQTVARFSRSDPAGEISTSLRVQDDGVVSAVVDWGTLTQSVVGPALEFEKWTRICVLQDAKDLRLVVGGHQTSATAEVATATAPDAVLLNDPLSGAWSAQTAFSDLRLYSRALADPELAETADRPSAAPGLLLWWPLDEDDGQKVRNASAAGPALDGTIEGPYYRITGRLLTVIAGRDSEAAVGSGGWVRPGQWTHVAAVSVPGSGIRLGERAWGDCGTSASFDASDGLTVAAWVEPVAAVSTAGQAVVSRWGSTVSDQAYQLSLTADGRPRACTVWTDTDASLVLEVEGTEPVTAGAAVHLAFTVASATASDSTADETTTVYSTTQSIVLRLFANGVRVGERTLARTLQKTSVTISGLVPPVVTSAPALQAATSSAPLLLGRATADSVGEAAMTYSGAVSDVALWQSALSPDEVAVLARRPADLVARRGLASPGAAWRCDEMTGSWASDSVGDNDCSLTSAVQWQVVPATASFAILVGGQPVSALSPVSLEAAGGLGQPQISLGGIRRNDDVLVPYTGELDEVRIWSDARTPEQISDTMRTPLSGRESALAAYWQLDAGSGLVVPDVTGNGADLTMMGPGLDASTVTWVTSTAPVSPEAAEARIIPDGPDLGAVRTSSTPSVAEYPDVQRTSSGELAAVMKRCYGYLPPGSPDPRMDTGFFVGDLALVHIGQVQTQPEVVGFVEGAPPLPSENLTQPYWVNAAWSDYRSYAAGSAVTLTESDDTRYLFSGQRKTGLKIEASVKAGAAAEQEIKPIVPPAAAVEGMSKLEGKLMAQFKADFEQATEFENQSSAAHAASVTTSEEMDGDWEGEPDRPSTWLVPALGRRFQPENNGIAVVKSLTADLYATVLRSTGALVGLSTVPDPRIPLDVNLISFPMDEDYIRAGSLDGQIGWTPLPGGSPSYYRPVEAYALKRRVEQQNARLEAVWRAYQVESAGHSDQTQAADVTSRAPDVTSASTGAPVVGTVDAWVWTAAGGLRKEQNEYASMRSEKITASYDRTLQGGVSGDFTVIPAWVGFTTEADFLAGEHLEVTAAKERESSTGFGIEVELTGEPFLKGCDVTVSPPRYTAQAVPGKVDSYRGMTFYLPSDSDNAAALFEDVIDPGWLASSGDASAVALRDAVAQTRSAWRVLHRITYVSRIAPEFSSDPVVTPPQTARVPVGVDANAALLDMVTAKVGSPTPSRQEVAAAVAVVLGMSKAGSTAAEAGTMLDAVPWWTALLDAAQIYGSPAQQALDALRIELTQYVVNGYAAGALPLVVAPSREVSRPQPGRRRGLRRRGRMTRAVAGAQRPEAPGTAPDGRSRGDTSRPVVVLEVSVPENVLPQRLPSG